MDFNVKKLVKDAGAALSRVVQLTEETLGTSEKTELDAHFEHLSERANTTKMWTEKILRDMEAMLTPNPGNRIEDFFYEKIDKKKPNRLSNLEYVGIDMIEAGNEFGSGVAYGSALIKVGQCQQKLGQIERDFIGTAANCYIQPLRKFLDGEMKTVSKEMHILESKRLDLDACKNRVRKARSMIGQQSAERELRIAQSEFDRQAEITKLLLEGVASSQAGHLRCLHEFVEAQARHYAQCHAIMQELQRELAGTNQQNSETVNNSDQEKARVVCDYEARDPSELNLMKDEVICVTSIAGDEDYVMGHRGLQHGKVPKAFVEIISFNMFN
ncbi:endophilin-B1 isoform X4 [Microplitis mediator]|uniref:endophilin-B1 isoform X2 n=1 Tax=Microplitis demolitor TaxID=69319 RepID=UPI0004CCCE45|nr:endophilin-B1 isoform X2 [Microplitis demolitor]XP_057320598.1 endophilin-B1 isoform X4 [Microplitis mediator]